MIGAPSFSAACSSCSPACRCALARQDGDLLSGIEHLRGLSQLLRRRADARCARRRRKCDAADCAWTPALRESFLLLEIRGECDVRHAAVAERSPACEIGQVFDVRGAHDSLVEDGHVLEELVELHVLLRHRADQIVKMHAGDREHRLAVQLRVVQSIQQVDAAGT